MFRRLAVLSLICATLGACDTMDGARTVQFWRPISEPNILMPMDQLQTKLDFDLGQCHCGTYPANATHNDMVQFQPDQQRMVQTGMTVAADTNGQCSQIPSLVVSECMRQRGWEPTNCSGRMPTAGGGALCAGYVQPIE